MQSLNYLIGEDQDTITQKIKTPVEENQDASINSKKYQQIASNRSLSFTKGCHNGQLEENRSQSQIQENKEKYQIEILNTTLANPSTQRKLIVEDHDNVQIDGQQSIQNNKNQYDLFTKINEISLNTDGADKRRQLLNTIDQDLEKIRMKKQSFTLEASIPVAYEDAKKFPPINLDMSIEGLFARQQIGNRSNQENEKTEHSNDLITSNLRKSSKKIQSERNMIKSMASKSYSDEKYANQLQLHSLDIRESKEAILGGNTTVLGRISQMIKQEQEEMFTPSLRQIGMQEDHIITRPATLIYIKKFISQLKKQLYFSVFKNLNSHQVKLINDLSYYEEGQKINSNLNNSKKCDKKLDKIQKDNLARINGAGIIYQSYLKNIIISSQSNAYMAFQVIMLASVFIQICIIPIQVCFNLQLNSIYILSIITLPVFFIGILLNCVTSYYCEGIEVKKQKKIIKRYLKTSFFQDISSFIALIISLQSNNQWISLIFLIRFNQIPKLINSIDDHFQLEHRFPSSFELLKLLFLIVTIGHYCCCGFIYLGQYEVDNNRYSWLIMRKIDQNEWSVKYLNGLYFSFITMITVGYGDITPQTEIEIIYVLFMTLITCGVFGYAINTIGSIFREMQIRKSELKQKF
ncbi:cation channel family protein (macronuclear) [Tetrahymena thermophila SB210]|uniref:Cation channel family protein n=1 Tax=Tetrahymena thermophila (strain SB210) TaxID=312017 RepID=Q22N95_TETTS|nr:cation channel family protein [Tetrahymena thermophila SB210]EAR86890.2 cation channel family protein [Tetrahymena thermophila SB210]|eukprot:XP_001007135.2 cation channel family protein [Tetrahymena thermophila SB210]